MKNLIQKNKKDKALSYLVLILFLSIITFSSLNFISFYRPNDKLIDKPYIEKMEELKFFYLDQLIFVNDSTEDNSKIAFLDWSIYDIAKFFLYPYRLARYFTYIDNSESEFLNFLKEEKIEYIFYWNQNYDFFINSTSLFLRIDSTSYEDYYLFEINRTSL